MIESYRPDKPVSLYIHVPFCRSRCDYCAFYSTLYREENRDRYYINIRNELESLVEDIKRPFYTVYFGGGNPILLGYERIVELLSIAGRYGRPQETTVEINPEDVSPELERLYPNVTRISTGIQSMSDRTLEFLNRRARVKDNIKAMEYLSSSPFVWNADLITAVGTTTVADTLYDIDKVAQYHPEHISFYCLTFEEGTPLISKTAPLGDEKETEFLTSGWDKLRENGYSHYEISAFALPGNECLHNRAYWTLGQYIGLGPAAESFLGYTTGTTMRNRETIEDFIRSPEFDCEKLTKEETEESYLLTALRTKDGIDKAYYSSRFGLPFDDLYSERIATLNSRWYNNTEDTFSLTENGMLMLNTIILTLSMVL